MPLPQPTHDPAQLRSDLDEYGYGIIENALDQATLKTTQERLFEQAEAERGIYHQQNPANPVKGAQWVNMLLNKGDIFLELIRHPLAMSMIEHILGPEFLISCVDSQIQLPGAETMPMHTDQWWLPPLHATGIPRVRASEMRRDLGTSLDPSPNQEKILPPLMANVMWLITDFTEENGATRLVPRSHLSGRAPDVSVPHKIASIPATGPAGTALVFDGRLWHSAWSNTTDKARYGITTACCGPQCRPLENYSRGMRPEVVESLPIELLPRLGFAAWSSYGHTGNLTDSPTHTGSEVLGPLSPGCDLDR